MSKILLFVTVVLGCCSSSAVLAGDTLDSYAEIRSFNNHLSEHDSSYNYQFETSNGIAQHEQGIGGYYATGSSQYYTPEGQLIQLTYTADENGFQPQGEHLPTPPPIPHEILKSLEWNRNHPEEEEESFDHHEQQQQQHHHHHHQQQQQQHETTHQHEEISQHEDVDHHHQLQHQHHHHHQHQHEEVQEQEDELPSNQYLASGHYDKKI